MFTRFFANFYSAGILTFFAPRNDAVVVKRNNNRDETRPIDEKGKTSAKCARPRKEEVTSNPLSRMISRWERSEIARRFNSILNVLAIDIRIPRKTHNEADKK